MRVKTSYYKLRRKLRLLLHGQIIFDKFLILTRVIEYIQAQNNMVPHAKRIIKYNQYSSTTLHAAGKQVCQKKFGRVKAA